MYYWVDIIEASNSGGGGGDSVLPSGGSLGKRENLLDAISISPCSRPVGPIATRLTTQTYHKIIPSLGHTCGSALRPGFNGHVEQRGQLMGSERPLWAHPEAEGPPHTRGGVREHPGPGRWAQGVGRCAAWVCARSRLHAQFIEVRRQGPSLSYTQSAPMHRRHLISQWLWGTGRAGRSVFSAV
jgi:hypothetical protein